MTVRFIPHSAIDQKLLIKIIEVKMKSWPYSIEEQLKWIEKNIDDNDVHVLLIDSKDNILAYLNLIEIETTINNVKCLAVGIGNVCAVEKGKGYGSTLIRKTNDYLTENKKTGFLFCNNQLLPFYQALNWEIVPQGSYTIDGIEPKTNVMGFNLRLNIKTMNYHGKIF